MPHFRLETNVPAEKVPATYCKDTTALLAKILGKPQSYCVATIVPGLQMAWGGDANGPCATATLMSIGKLGVEENKKHAAALYEHVHKNLGIPKDKMYICFQDEKSSNVGYNGTTFHDILG